MMTPQQKAKIQRKIDKMMREQKMDPGEAIAMLVSMALSIMVQVYRNEDKTPISFDQAKLMMERQLAVSREPQPDTNGLAVLPDPEPEPELSVEQRLENAKLGTKPISQEEAMRIIEEGSRPPEGAA